MLKPQSELIKKLAEIMIEGYTADRDPAVVKLKKIVELIQAGKWFNAQNLIKAPDLKTNMMGRKEWYQNVPSLKDVGDTYEKTIDLIERANPKSVEAINKIIDALKKSEKEINVLQRQTPRA